MFSVLIGQVDANAALVLAVLFITICIIVTSMIVKRRSRLQINNEFELAKIRQADATALASGELAVKRDVQMAKLSQNLITSHRDTNDD